MLSRLVKVKWDKTEAVPNREQSPTASSCSRDCWEFTE